MFHLIDFCRLCLSFEGELNNICNDDTMEKIVACISNLEFDEKLPALICTKCSDQLDNFFDFRNQCLRSEFLLNGYIEKFPLKDNEKFFNSQLKVNIVQNCGVSSNSVGANRQDVNKQYFKSVSISNPRKTTKSFDLKECSDSLKSTTCNKKSRDKKVICSNKPVFSENVISEDSVIHSDEDDVFLEEEDDEIIKSSTSLISENQNGKRKSENTEKLARKNSKLETNSIDPDLPPGMYTDITELVKIRKRGVQIRMQEKNKQNIIDKLQENDKKHVNTETSRNSKAQSNARHSNSLITNTTLSSSKPFTFDRKIEDLLANKFHNIPVNHSPNIDKLVNAKLKHFKNVSANSNMIANEINSIQTYDIETASPFSNQYIGSRDTAESINTAKSPSTQVLESSATTDSILACYLIGDLEKVAENTNSSSSTGNCTMGHCTPLYSDSVSQNTEMVDEVEDIIEQEIQNDYTANIQMQNLNPNSVLKTYPVNGETGIPTDKDFHQMVVEIRENIEIKSNSTMTKSNIETKTSNLISILKINSVDKETSITTDTDFEQNITQHCLALCQLEESKPKSNELNIPMKLPLNTRKDKQNIAIPFELISNKVPFENNKKPPYSILNKKALNRQTNSKFVLGKSNKKQKHPCTSSLPQAENHKYQLIVNNKTSSSSLGHDKNATNDNENLKIQLVKLGDVHLLVTDSMITRTPPGMEEDIDSHIQNEIIEPAHDLTEECVPLSIFDDEPTFKSEDCDIPLLQEILEHGDTDWNESGYFLNENPSTSTATYNDSNSSVPTNDSHIPQQGEHNYCLTNSTSSYTEMLRYNSSLYPKSSVSKRMEFLLNRKERKRDCSKIPKKKPKFVVDDPLNILQPFEDISSKYRRTKRLARIKSTMRRNKRKRAASRKSKQTLPIKESVPAVDLENSDVDVETVGEEDVKTVVDENVDHLRKCTSNVNGTFNDLNRKNEAERLRRLEFRKNLHRLDSTLSEIYVTPVDTSTTSLKDTLDKSVECINYVQKKSQLLNEIYNIELSKQHMLLEKHAALLEKVAA